MSRILEDILAQVIQEQEDMLASAEADVVVPLVDDGQSASSKTGPSDDSLVALPAPAPALPTPVTAVPTPVAAVPSPVARKVTSLDDVVARHETRDSELQPAVSRGA